MSRKIKFRGKRVDNGEWVYGFVIIDPSENIAYIVTIDDSGRDEIEVIPETVNQYIGLKDDKRKDIYERDIVIFDDSDIGGRKHVGEIIWCDDQSLGNLAWGLWVKKRGYLQTDFLGKLKVIGNIYENPELLR